MPMEPSPFLCAMSSLTLLDARHLEPRELLAVAGRALVAALGLELEDADLGAALVPHDPGLDRHLAERRAEQRLVAARVEQRLEVDRRALVGGEALDEERGSLLDAVLLAAGADYCVRGFGHSIRSLAGFGWDFGVRTRTAPSASAATAPRLRLYCVVDIGFACQARRSFLALAFG